MTTISEIFMRFRTTIKESANLITNKAGGKAYPITRKEEFLFAVLSSFLKDTFYETCDEHIERLKKLMREIPDKQFIAKVAIFARNEFGMRSVSHLIAIELLLQVKHELWVKHAIAHTIRRPDDILEMVAYYFSLHKNVGYKKGLPASLRKGIQLSLSKFDEYQLAKYRGSNSNVKMVDIINLVHPQPSDINKDVLEKLIKNELRSKNTWESELSEAGKTEDKEDLDELKGNVWEKLIIEKKLGYFALLKNLRNIINYAPDALDAAIALLIDEHLIRKSLVLPFRYVKAIEQIEQIRSEQSKKVIKALNKAAEISLCNVPTFKGSTLIALDVSGSMQGLPITIGSLFAAALLKKNSNIDLMLFSTSACYYTPNTDDSILSLANLIRSKITNGGTNFHSIFLGSKLPYTRIILLSDMQAWINADASLVQTLEVYKKNYQANPFIYSFDLNGYGSLQFPRENIFCVAGFSEKVFDFMKSLEVGGSDLMNKVNSIQW